MRCLKNTLLTAVGLTTALCSANAIAGDSFVKAFEDGTPYLDVRYRYEHVDQDGFNDDAHASTLRTKLGFKSGEVHGFSGLLELENISEIGNDNYNNTINGRTSRPVVADVESNELNQAYLQYTGFADTQLRLGRQIVNLDAQRFIGSVGWRQNDQVLDAVTAVNTSLEDTKITYGYINRVNRIFSNESAAGDWESNSHILNVANTSLPIGKIVGYAYLLDFENDSPANSSKTFGASLNGKQALSETVDFKYHLEYARQSEHGDNPTSYDADYYHIAPALAWNGFTATVGYEVLGSDNGTIGFATPLATLHKFNGWADKFLATPANGLEDLYFDVTYKFKGIEGDGAFLNGLLVKAQYHEFSADEGSADYGDEFGLHLQMPIEDNYYVQARFADYDADTFATDTQKLILGVGAKF